MSTRARRLVALEARLRQVDGDELRELLRVMSYGELLALEAAVVPHGDVAPALQAGDEVTIALITAARARRQGHHVAPLFNEPARRYVRTPHPTSPHDRASLAQLAEIGSAEEDDLPTLGQAIATARPDRVSSNLPCAPGPATERILFRTLRELRDSNGRILGSGRCANTWPGVACRSRKIAVRESFLRWEGREAGDVVGTTSRRPLSRD